jgi:hypothetical protein
MAVEYPKTYHYLKQFEDLLRTSAIYTRYFRPSDPFYSMFNVGEYTFAPYKVVLREIASELTCAVVGSVNGRPIVPDHKLVLCPFEVQAEAHFVCAALNSSAARFTVGSYSVETQFSNHVFEHVALPEFDNTKPVHRHLAALSQQAHAATSAGDAARVREIEGEIDRLAAQLWGLTDAELREIQQSLAELG